MAYGAIIGQTPTVQASAEMTSYNNDNTSSVITADNVQGAIDQLFTSVSNGKSQIASAITDMGVSTSANDSFAQMATNIGNIETGYDTSQVTATAATVRSGYKFVNSSGQLITGTIPSKGAQTYTPKTVSQTIAKGQYLSGNQTIQGDENLKASNIKSGVSIFGVSGSYSGINIIQGAYNYNLNLIQENGKSYMDIFVSGLQNKQILLVLNDELTWGSGLEAIKGIEMCYYFSPGDFNLYWYMYPIGMEGEEYKFIATYMLSIDNRKIIETFSDKIRINITQYIDNTSGKAEGSHTSRNLFYIIYKD